MLQFKVAAMHPVKHNNKITKCRFYNSMTAMHQTKHVRVQNCSMSVCDITITSSLFSPCLFAFMSISGSESVTSRVGTELAEGMAAKKTQAGTKVCSQFAFKA